MVFGDIFKINSFDFPDMIHKSKQDPQLASLSNGGFVVTYTSTHQDLSYEGVFGQIYRADGTLQGDEFRINSYTDYDQNRSSVTGLKDGGFLVVWHVASEATTGAEAIHAQRFNADGSAYGSEFRISPDNYVILVSGTQVELPEVKALEDGGFVTVWTAKDYNTTLDNGNYTTTYENIVIRGQVYNANNSKQGAEFEVPKTSDNEHGEVSVGALKNGGFVVSYDLIKTQAVSNGIIRTQLGIQAQRYDSNANVVGAAFADMGSSSHNSKVVGLTDGKFVIISYTPSAIVPSTPGTNFDIKGQLYAASGNKIGDVFRISQAADGSDTDPDVTALNNGGFAVTWSQGVIGGAHPRTVGRIYDNNGAPQTGELQISDGAAFNWDVAPTIAAFGAGGFVAAWSVGLQYFQGQAILGVIYDANGTHGGTNLSIGSHDVTGTAGDDFIAQYFGNVTLRGEAGHDKILAFRGANILDGGADSDFIIGGIKGDVINGGDGNDVIMGDGSIVRGGSDRIKGGKGDDAMMGGKGVDVFIFNPNDGHDVIAAFSANAILQQAEGYSLRVNKQKFHYRDADFEVDVDVIELHGFSSVNANNVMSFVSDGDTGAVFSAEGTEILFHDILTSQLSASDFLFV